MKRLVPLVALLAIGTVPAAAAVGEWINGGKARIRLIAAGVDASGHLNAGIEIELESGWKTYWRNPGDAGIAPLIDFTDSRNAGPIEVAFPTPERHDDGYTVTNVYEDDVILPLSAMLADPKAATELALKLDIGVCQEVCIPDHFEATLTLDPGAADPVAGAALEQARNRLPKPAEPGTFAVEKIWRDGGTDKRPAFSFAATLPDAKDADIFVEGPPDWYSDVPKLVGNDGGRAVYRVTFDRLVAKTALAGARLRITMVSAGRAVEQWIRLD